MDEPILLQKIELVILVVVIVEIKVMIFEGTRNLDSRVWALGVLQS